MPPTTPELVDDENVGGSDAFFQPDLYCDEPEFKQQLQSFWLSTAMDAIRPKRGPQESRLERFEVLVLNFLAAGGKALAVPMGKFGEVEYEKSRYNKRGITDRFRELVNLLGDHGLLEIDKGDFKKKRRTAVKPLGPLKKLIRRLEPLAPAIEYRGEIVMLKDRHGRLVDYEDSEETNRWRYVVEGLNALLRDTQVAWRSGRKLKEHKGQVVFQRKFNRQSFDCLGRLYCGAVQTLRKTTRATILLNGEETAEPDFKGLHPRLLYAAEGLQIAPEVDVYEFAKTAKVSAGLRDSMTKKQMRDLAKSVQFCAFNAKGKRSACKAIKHKHHIEYSDARALYDAMAAQHVPIAQYFGADMGIRLQRLDSDIMTLVLAEMVALGIPGLPIHDSVVCPKRTLATVTSIMAAAAELYVGVALPTDPANNASAKHQLSSDYAKAVASEAAKHDQPIGIIKLRAEAERYVKPLTEREIKRLEKLQREADTAIVY
jgi:hypothetical protein